MQGATYWVGQDNNIYYGDGQGGGVRNVGTALGRTRPDATGFFDPWADATESPMRFNATKVADPSGTTLGASTAPTRGTTTPARVAPVLNQIGVDGTNASINEIPGLLRDALAAEQTGFNNTNARLNTQEAEQQGIYDKSTQTNMNNSDANFMDSIRAGIKGLGSLTQMLRGSGATGGTAQNQARDLVGGITASDIRGGADTQQENQTGLDDSFNAFRGSLKDRRDEATDLNANNIKAITRDSNTQLQDLYDTMSGYYGAAEMAPQAQNYGARSMALTPSIAADSRTQVSQYGGAPIAVKAPELTAFSGNSQPDAIQTPKNGQVGSGIFTMDDERRREREQVPVGV